MKKLITLILILSLLGSTALAELGNRLKVVKCEEYVTLREEPSTKTGYQDDEEGTHVYYSDEAPVLYKEGRGSCESEGWIVSYDWDTKEEVERVLVNHDIYSAGVNVYWRGIHKRDS